MEDHITRRKFLQLVGGTFLFPQKIIGGLEKLASFEYKNITHSQILWDEIQNGMYFTRVDVLRDNKELVDRIAIVRLNPKNNKIRVFSTYEPQRAYKPLTIEEWQNETGASVMFNSAQYQGKPNYGAPVGLIITDGRKRGPFYNSKVRGMLVAEPKDKNLPSVDLLDFDYDKFDQKTTTYTQGVQHWPILLDRHGKIKVAKSDWQANRTVVAKNRNNELLVFVTEGGFFTLYNLARFLKESPFDVHTAMNMDGGYEASMCIRTPEFNYVTYGQFETYGPNKDASVLGARIRIPTAIGIFPRK